MSSGPFQFLIEITQKLTGGDVGSRLGDLQGKIAGVVAAAGVLAVAAAAGVVAFAAWGMAAAGAAVAFARTSAILSGSAAAGRANAAAVDAVAAATGQSVDSLRSAATALEAAHLSGQTFKNTLKSIADETEVLGPAAAGQLQGIVDKAGALGHFDVKAKGLAGLGISMADIARQMGMTVPAMEAAMKAGKITTEQGMDAMNAAIKARLGGAAAAAGNDLGPQLQRLHDFVSKLFDGLKTGPFLAALHSFVSMFDQSTSSGKQMHAVVLLVFNGLLSAATAVMPYVKTFFQALVIVALQLYIAVKPIGQAIASAFPAASGKGTLATMVTMIKVGAAVVAGLVAIAAVMGVVAVASAAWSAILAVVSVAEGIYTAVTWAAAAAELVLASPILLIVVAIVALIAVIALVATYWDQMSNRAKVALMLIFLPITLIVGAVMAVIAAVRGLISIWPQIAAGASIIFDAIASPFEAALAFLDGLDLGSIGSALIDGLVNGIASGAGAVVDAITAMASAAMGALKSILGIHSPSKVFATMGGHTAAGFAEGVDDGAADVNKSVSAMVEVPKGKGGKGGGAKGKAGKGGPVVVHIHIHGVKDSLDMISLIEQRVTALFESLDLSGPEPELT